jgi:DNA-binding beta-propeller fold protein YncE/plastocyanin
MSHTPCKKPAILLLAFLLLVPLASLRAGGQGFGPVGGSSHEVVLEAVELPDGLYAYRMKSHRIDGRDVTSTRYGANSKPSIPGPTIVLTEGDAVKLTLINKVSCDRLPDKFTGGRETPGRAAIGVHVHGVHYKIESDGTPKDVNMMRTQAAPCDGGAYTYEWNAGPGTAGTWPYHDHTFTEETGAEALGLFGTLIVNPKGGSVKALVDGETKEVPVAEIKKDYVLWMTSTRAAGRSLFYGMEIDNERHGKQTPLWVNPTLIATEGDLVRFHVLGIGDEFHAIHLHAHRWIEPEETKRIIDVRDIAPLEKHVFVVRAGESVGPGDWMYHCHVFRHMEEGMSGMFRVLAKGEDDTLPPVGAVFTQSDEPASFMKAIDRGLLEALDPREGIGFPLDFIGSHSRSLTVVRPGETVLWNMRDSVTVHTITGLIWPKGAKAGDTPFPFDRNLTIRGSTYLTDNKGRPVGLTQPGLYVFVCKIHPYMFGAVIVDEDGALPLDLGNELSILTRTGGLPGNLPTTVPSLSAVPSMLLSTFFVVTDPSNWKDYTQNTWQVRFPKVDVQGSTDGKNPTTVNLQNALGKTMPGIREELKTPKQPGIGEVWVNTQFELTLNKQHPAPGFTFANVVDAGPAAKPGSITVVDADRWTIDRKIALPGDSMVHPHNMWADSTLETIYQTQWFERRLTAIDRARGEPIGTTVVGQSPSHVITAPQTNRIFVALNGEEQVAEIDPRTLSITRELSMGTNSHPHGHWIGLFRGDPGKPFIVTPNFFSNDSTIYDLVDNEACKVKSGAAPIAIGVTPDGGKYYVADFLGNSITVVETADEDGDGDVDCGHVATTVDLLADANGDGNPDGGLPIQTPVSPDGRWVVTAHTLTRTITVIDTKTDKVAAVLPCEPGCHGVNWGAKQGGGYYAYVASKFSNALIVVDPRDGRHAEVVGKLLLAGHFATRSDDRIIGLPGMGGQGVLPLPVMYDGYIQDTVNVCGKNSGLCSYKVASWLSKLNDAQRNPR